MYSFASDIAKELCQQVGVDDPTVACRRIAYSILEECDIVTWPVNLCRIAAYMEAEISVNSDSNHDGATYRRNGKTYIDLAQVRSRGRQRFTLAHEIMHLAMPRTTSTNRSHFQLEVVNQPTCVEEEEEFLCNLGASHLVMPRHLVRDWLAELPNVRFSNKALEHLARDFQVSLQACAIGVVEAIDKPVQIVGWKKPLDNIIRPHQISKTSEFPTAHQVPLDYEIQSHRQLYQYVERGSCAGNLDAFRLRTESIDVILVSDHKRLSNHPVLSMISVFSPTVVPDWPKSLRRHV